MIVSVVMVLQRIEGCSDREAVDRFCFDARWKYAAGGLDFDFPGFVHTVLVDMRARLAASDRPDRIFEVTLGAAKAAGLVGRKRVLDSTALYDAVATMDTVTLIRSAIRALLKVAAGEGDGLTAVRLRGLLGGADNYVDAGKPVGDYDDPDQRLAIVDRLARDAVAVLGGLEGHMISSELSQAAQLLATVVGQDLDCDQDGTFRIARRVAKDRVISTVDPQTRHGHKTSARGFDGYKGHIAVDPDSEIITNTVVSPGNTGDGASATDLLTDDLPANAAADDVPCDPIVVYGDAAYGSGDLLADLDDADVVNMCKVARPTSPDGRFTKDEFTIDQDAGVVHCPAGNTAPLRGAGEGKAASFGPVCQSCPLAAMCTAAKNGRTVRVGPHETLLADARARQRDPEWIADYRATRPKVERKIGHLMRRRHGGRRARMRGQTKIAADFSLLAAAVNMARLGVLGYANPATS